VLVLFALLAPGSPPIGLIRIEDVALGAITGVVVGLLLWPRGAAAEIRRAMSEAYRAGARLLDNAVARVVAPAGSGSASEPVALVEVRGAALRLDDALRQYLADRGGKSQQTDDLMLVCVGAERLRMSGEAIASLEGGQDHVAAPPAELIALVRRRAAELTHWEHCLADAFVASAQHAVTVPDPPDADLEARLLHWVGQHPQQAKAALTGESSPAALAPSGVGTVTPSAVMWTTIHLDHVARLQILLQPRIVAILPGGAEVTPPRTQVSSVAG
jgi:uncharacterized membrane protein YccC